MSICPTLATPAFWWLDTSFGMLVFVLFFLTWGLIIVALTLFIINQLRQLQCNNKKKRR